MGHLLARALQASRVRLCQRLHSVLDSGSSFLGPDLYAAFQVRPQNECRNYSL